MTDLGLVFLPQLPPAQLRAVVEAADGAGVDELWLWEDCFRESGIATASAALAWSTRMRVGVGLMPVPLRNVALSAMELATLAGLFPGRLLPAIGHGVQDWMGQVGVRAASPMGLLREYAVALRQLLDGDEVTVDGAYVHLDAVRLDWPPASPPPVLIGAVGPRTLELAGEVGDGTILTGGTTPAAVRAARAAIDTGRARAGRTGPHRVTVYLIAATGPTATARLADDLARWELDPGADLAVAGSAADIAAAVRRWADAGADAVVLQPTPDDPDPAGFARFVGADVRAALRA